MTRPLTQRRVFWAVWLVLAAGLGVALYVWMPPARRWAVERGPNGTTLWAGDDALAIVLPGGGDNGRVRLIKAATGEEAGRFLGSAGETLAYSATVARGSFHQGCDNDGREIVVLTDPGDGQPKRIGRLDLAERRETWVDVELERFNAYVFSPDCRWLALHYLQGRYRVVDTVEGKVVASFQVNQLNWPPAAPVWQSDFGKFGPGCFIVPFDGDQIGDMGLHIVYLPSGEVLEIDNAATVEQWEDGPLLVVRACGARWAVSVWDLDKRERACELDLDKRLTRRAFSSDRRLLATSPQQEDVPPPVQVWDPRTGRKVAELSAPAPATGTFLPGTHHLLHRWCTNNVQHMVLYDVDNGRELWHREWPEPVVSRIHVSYDGKTIVIAHGASGALHTADGIAHGADRSFDIVDAATGQSRAAVTLPNPLTVAPDWKANVVLAQERREREERSLWRRWLDLPAPDARSLAVHAYDAATGRHLATAPCRNSVGGWMTDGGRTLVTERFRTEVRNNIMEVVGGTLEGWDVPPPRPWGWIVVPPLVMLALGFLPRRATKEHEGRQKRE